MSVGGLVEILNCHPYLWNCIDSFPVEESGQAQFLNGFQLSSYFRFVTLHCMAKINLRNIRACCILSYTILFTLLIFSRSPVKFSGIFSRLSHI